MKKYYMYYILATLFLSVSMGIAQDRAKTNFSSNPFLNRFGYRLSFYNLNRFDSNILKLRSTRPDLYGGVYPSLTIEYPLSSSTKIAGMYRFGTERFRSTSFLNTLSHWSLLSLTHRFNPNWAVELYGILNNSNQPDVTTLHSAYKFASYAQNRNGIKFKWTKSPVTLFTIEYYTYNRFYSGLFVNPRTKQKDILHASALSWLHLFTPETLGYLKIGYQQNMSNNISYRYSVPYLDAFAQRRIGKSIKLQFLNRLSMRKFEKRPLSTSIFINRRDIINTVMIGVQKDFGDFISLLSRYYFQKDFSNEPRRQFTDHTISIGLEISLGKSASLITTDAERQILNQNVISEQISAEKLTNFGYSYLLKRKYNKSLAYSLQAISINPGIAEAHINAGIAYYKKGMISQAIKEWSLSLALKPNNQVAALLNKAKKEQQKTASF